MKPREAQRGTERHREAQNRQGMPMYAQRGSWSPREAQKRPRDAHICPVNRLGAPYTKPPGELNTY